MGRRQVTRLLRQMGLRATQPKKYKGGQRKEHMTSPHLRQCLISSRSIPLGDKASRLKEIVEKAGEKVLPLPTYSPDLNPIENYWAVAKARIRKYRKTNQLLVDILDQVLCMT